MQKIKQLCQLAKRHHSITATIGYALLTALFTFPLIFNFSSALPQGGGDTYQSWANITAQYESIAQLDFTDGFALALKQLGTYSPYVLLKAIFGNTYSAYNAMFFLSYILSGLGAYLLALHFVGRKVPAFLAGMLFAFVPFHYYQTVAVHLGSMQQQWIPFAALFLIRFLDSQKFKDFVGTGIFLFLLAISEHQLLAFSLLFFLAIAVVKFVQKPALLRNKKIWSYVGVAAVFFAILVFTVFGDLLKVATSGDNFLDPGSGAAKKYAMNVLEPLVMPGFHALWPGMNTFFRKTVGVDADSRDSYFLGYSVLILLGLFLWQFYRKKSLKLDRDDQKGIQLWTWMAGIFFVFALGPGVKIFTVDVYLPYQIVYKFFPFYDNIRVTGRLFMFAILSFSMLLAYAIAHVKLSANKKKYLSIALGVIMLMEFWVAPLKIMSVAYSPYYDEMAKDSRDYKILEIPGSTDYEFASYKLLTNAVHHKVSVDGMALARSVDGQFHWQQTTPVVKQLLYTLPKGNDPLDQDADIAPQFDYARATELLNFYNIKKIIINKQYTTKEEQRAIANFIDATIETENRFEDGFIIAYTVKEKQPQGMYYQINTDEKLFSDTFKDENKLIARQIADGATVTVVNMGSTPIATTVSLEGRSPKESISVSVDYGLADQKQKTNAGAGVFDATYKTIQFPITVAPGITTITLHVTDQNGKPATYNRKQRDTGLTIKSIRIDQ